MTSIDDYLTIFGLALIFGATFAIYAFLIMRKARNLRAAISQLQDRTDDAGDVT